MIAVVDCNNDLNTMQVIPSKTRSLPAVVSGTFDLELLDMFRQDLGLIKVQYHRSNALLPIGVLTTVSQIIMLHSFLIFRILSQLGSFIPNSALPTLFGFFLGGGGTFYAALRLTIALRTKSPSLENKLNQSH